MIVSRYSSCHILYQVVIWPCLHMCISWQPAHTHWVGRMAVLGDSSDCDTLAMSVWHEEFTFFYCGSGGMFWGVIFNAHLIYFIFRNSLIKWSSFRWNPKDLWGRVSLFLVITFTGLLMHECVWERVWVNLTLWYGTFFNASILT